MGKKKIFDSFLRFAVFWRLSSREGEKSRASKQFLYLFSIQLFYVVICKNGAPHNRASLWSKTASAKTRATIASTTGTARMAMHGSCREGAGMVKDVSSFSKVTVA